MKKVDQRILRTRRSLSDALVNMSYEIGYDAVTIKDISRYAEVSYATFFRHFKHKHDLLTYVIRSSMEEIMDMPKAKMSPYEEALALYRYLGRRPAISRLYASLPPDHESVRYVYKMYSEFVHTSYDARDEMLVPMDVIANHVAASACALFRWWIARDMEYPAEQMATMHCELIIKPMAMLATDPRSENDVHGVVD